MRNFSSLDEMLAFLAKTADRGKRIYNRIPTKVKNALAPGNYFIQDSGYGFLIFGKILAPENAHDRYMLEHNTHLRLVHAYSTACPEGEIGTASATNILPCPKSMFEMAKDRNWELTLNDLKNITEFFERLFDNSKDNQ
jgi:hypothetical protein